MLVSNVIKEKNFQGGFSNDDDDYDYRCGGFRL